MLFAFSKDEFVETYIPTVCETFVKEIQVEGQKVELVLWDTAGQEDYDRLRPVAYNRSHAVIICYCVDNWTSYDNVQLKWYREVRHFCPNIPIILVATKLDLRNQSERPPNGTVSEAEGTFLAEKLGAEAYTECSAKTREGIQRVFEIAAKEILRQEKSSPKKTQSTCLVT